jgi:type I restriction enzyme S subunit
MMKKFKDLVTANGVFSDGDWVESKDQDPNGDVRLIQLADIGVGTFINKSNRFMTSEKAEELKCTYLEKGDILIARMPDPIGRACIFPELKNKCVTVVDICIVRPASDEIDSRWLMHLINSERFNNQILKFVTGTTRQRISRGNLAKLDVEVPPLEDQKRIATILDKADSVRRKRQQAIDLADDFLRSVFLDMFGDPVTNPKGWDVELLGEHIQHANNGLSRRRKIEENIGDIVLRLQDVHYEGIRFAKELNRIELEDKEKSRYRLDIGDLLFIRVNGNPEYVGRSAVFEGFNEEVFHNDHLIRIKVKDSFNSRFLSYMLNQPGGKKIISSKTKTSAGQHTISQGGIESLEFIVPPIDLQNKFVNIQSTVNKQLNKQSVSFIELTHSFSSLSQKAFAGEL